MRETYFRAWDTYNQAWADEYLAITEDGYVVEIKNDGTIEYWKDRFIIEFDTGLKDKNGKKICEGDIVDYAGECTCVIQYEDEGARFIHKDISDDFPFGFNGLEEYNGKLFEVIGNIHENPELLDVKKEG